VPAHINAAEIDGYLRQLAGVDNIHDLHIWALSTTENALTVHLIMPEGYPGDDFMDNIMGTLKTRFSLHHCTLQIERGTTSHSCCLAS
jgi:cobalt-zinc-cadmium efflux system protein